MDVLDEPGLSKEVLKVALGLVNQNNIFVKNLPLNTSVREVREFFEKIGEIKDRNGVRLP